METLTLKLTEVLEISIESAIELYPVLKSQFVSYNILNAINSAMISLAIIGGIGLFFTSIMLFVEISDTWKNEDDVKTYKKIIKFSAMVFITSILIMTISSILKYNLATDFMLIKTFLN